MEIAIVMLGTLILWAFILITLIIVSKGLWIINPVFEESKFTVSMSVEGVNLPSEDVTKEIREALKSLELSVGFSLVIVSVFGTIILLELPDSFIWLGILFFSTVPILGYKVLNSLKKLKE